MGNSDSRSSSPAPHSDATVLAHTREYRLLTHLARDDLAATLEFLRRDKYFPECIQLSKWEADQQNEQRRWKQELEQHQKLQQQQQLQSEHSQPRVVPLDAPSSSSSSSHPSSPPSSLSSSSSSAALSSSRLNCYRFAALDLDPNYFVDAQQSQTFICGICLLICKNPPNLPCAHLFCRSCIDALPLYNGPARTMSDHEKTCPTCRQRFDAQKLDTNHLAVSMIESLQVTCPHRNQGCDATPRVLGKGGRNLRSHLELECRFEKAQCIYCEKMIAREDRDAHAINCVARANQMRAMEEAAAQQKAATKGRPTFAQTSSASSSSSSSSSSSPSAQYASSILHTMSRFSHLPAEIRRQLAINHYSLHAGGFTLLHQAVVMCSPRFVQGLLEAGADVHARSTQPLDGKDDSRKESGDYFYRNELSPTDLVLAPKKKSEALPIGVDRYADRLVFQMNSSLKYRDTGHTPLMLCIIFARDSLVEQQVALLLQAGASAEINARTSEEQWSALMFAAQRGHAQVYSMLREAGADYKAVNRDGHHALGVAMQWAKEANADMVKSIEAEREKIKREVVVVLGDHYRMAQVSVDDILHYAGLKH